MNAAGKTRLSFDRAAVAGFCDRWQIAELAFFGSVLRDDFGPASDVDVLVTFEPEARWSLLDHTVMEQELGQILDRKVDLLTRRAVERSSNWLRRQAILESAQPYHAA